MACQEPGPLEELRGTVKPYGRHALALSGWTTWQATIEEQDDLVGQMARETKELKDRVDPPPKFTALRTKPTGEGIDLLVMPEAVIYRGVDADAWTRIRDEHLAGERPVEALAPEPSPGHHILVCNHGARDARCGACGPLVAKALEEAIAERGLEDVHVHRSSHVGGHRFAGNVLIYPGGAWYGYVRPEDAGTLLDHVLAGKRWDAHFRGSRDQ